MKEDGDTGRDDEHEGIKVTKNQTFHSIKLLFFSYKSPFIDFRDEE